jgi:hypothetical protein
MDIKDVKGRGSNLGTVTNLTRVFVNFFSRSTKIPGYCLKLGPRRLVSRFAQSNFKIQVRRGVTA